MIPGEAGVLLLRQCGGGPRWLAVRNVLVSCVYIRMYECCGDIVVCCYSMYIYDMTSVKPNL